jgi:hypothetical protein
MKVTIRSPVGARGGAPISAALTNPVIMAGDSLLSEGNLGVLVAEGSEASVYRMDECTAMRVPRDASLSRLLRMTSALRAAADHGVPVPMLKQSAFVDPGNALLQEYLDPRSLLHQLVCRPWSVRTVGKIMGSVHAAIHDVYAPDDLPSIRDLLLEKALAVGRFDPARRLSAALSLRELGGDQLLHGDFNPANLLRRTGGRDWLAIDWSHSAKGHPAADIAYSLTMIELGSPPEATSLRLPRSASSLGRRLLKSAYLAEYLKHRSIDWPTVRVWIKAWRLVYAPRDHRQ